MANPPLSADAHARLMALQAEMASILSGGTASAAEQRKLYGAGLSQPTPKVAFENEISKANARPCSFIDSSQRSTTTDLNYLTVKQFDLCHRSQAEKRSSHEIPEGYPGFCCVRCGRKFYFGDGEILMKTFTDRLQGHLSKCPVLLENPNDRRDLTLAIEHAHTTLRDAQKKELGQKGTLSFFCQHIMDDIQRRANMEPLTSICPLPASPSLASTSGSSSSAAAMPVARADAAARALPKNDGRAIVESSDEGFSTPCRYELFSQFKISHLTEREKLQGGGGYRNFPKGYPGLYCLHCRRPVLFCSSIDKFTTKACRRARDHLEKCTKLSDQLKERAVAVYEEAKRRETRGANVFLQQLWKRLEHAKESCNESGGSNNNDLPFQPLFEMPKYEIFSRSAVTPSRYVSNFEKPRAKRKRAGSLDESYDSSDSSDEIPDQANNVKGVHRKWNKWEAQYYWMGRWRSIGLFKKKDQAVRAREIMREQMTHFSESSSNLSSAADDFFKEAKKVVRARVDIDY